MREHFNFLEVSAGLIFFEEHMLVEKLRKINITANQESTVVCVCGESLGLGPSCFLPCFCGESLGLGPSCFLPCFRGTALCLAVLLGAGRDPGRADRQWTRLSETNTGFTERPGSPLTFHLGFQSLQRSTGTSCGAWLQAPSLTSEGP